MSYTSEQIIAYFLYGSFSTPTEKVDPNLIREAGDEDSHLQVNVAEFMTTGAGRFALPSQFELVQQFFSGDIPAGSYSKTELANLMGLSYFGLVVQQVNFRDGTNDYADRVLIWNNTEFELDDGVRFIVDGSGNKHIENLRVMPVGSENFDFIGTGWSHFGNAIIEPWFDSSGLGRTVVIDFDPTGHVIDNSYDEADFAADQATAASWATGADPVALLAAASEIDQLAQDLHSAGVTQFLDLLDRPIVYADQDDAAFALNALLGPDAAKASNGVVVVGSNNSDIIDGFVDAFYTGQNLLIAGGGDDHFTHLGTSTVAIGGVGNDTFDVDTGDTCLISGGAGDDQINVAAGSVAVVWGGAGADTINLSTSTLFQITVVHCEDASEELFANLDPGLLVPTEAIAGITHLLWINPDEDDILALDGLSLSGASYGMIAHDTYIPGTDNYHEYFGYQSTSGHYIVPDDVSGSIGIFSDFIFENGYWKHSGEFTGFQGVIFGVEDGFLGSTFSADDPTPQYKSYWGAVELYETGPNYVDGAFGNRLEWDLADFVRSEPVSDMLL